ncbi:Hypothetical predicted protein [Podarcis lilfordi]|uniref:Uncharacterized protein n=1 Tax=Podarcis lilfordi TaxID=74358 RepID=A0AA35KNU2_9SAUR|nr:Hypothetical predicted protein [Podarcis lilfordi]
MHKSSLDKSSSKCPHQLREGSDSDHNREELIYCPSRTIKIVKSTLFFPSIPSSSAVRRPAQMWSHPTYSQASKWMKMYRVPLSSSEPEAG